MERDYDVVVIGSGAAGLSAAVAAADSGASVIVLEADDKVGGSSRLSGGHFYAAGTSVQREAGILDDTPDDMFSYYMTLNQWNVEPGGGAHLLRQRGADVRVAAQPGRGLQAGSGSTSPASTRCRAAIPRRGRGWRWCACSTPSASSGAWTWP